MIILGLHTGHDAGAAVFRDEKLVSFCKEERVSRIKNDGGFFALASIDEALDAVGLTRKDVDVVALTRTRIPEHTFRKTSHPVQTLKRKLMPAPTRDLNLAGQMRKTGLDETALIDQSLLRKALGVGPKTEIYFANHHYCHVAAAWYYTDWDEGLFLSCDGGGDYAQYSAYLDAGKGLECVLGGDETLKTPQNTGASIGLAYAFATEICGFMPNRHEGKLTGLAAFGKPIRAEQILGLWHIDKETGALSSEMQGAAALKQALKSIFEGDSREDVAASIQVATESLLVEWVETLRALHGGRYIGLSGGVFSNVRMNQKIAELEGVDEVFVFPAMSDEGLPVGACIDYWVNRLGNPVERERLTSLYFGRHYSGDDLLEAARQGGFRVEAGDEPARQAADLIAQGGVGAIFYGGMEMGPRALGARSIVASPADRGVNDSINQRLQRTEFMPFAPFVRENDAQELFDISDKNLYPSRFMTITTDVKDEWKSRIPAVVHVDGTARPQVIYREDNPLYYDVLTEFAALTGLKSLVNTSFNAHEEPIINTPEEALAALKDDRVDFLFCESGLVFPGA
ncbi:hypothetical protein A3730_01680 [Alcanivorax sp. HI0044]|uniref:carbamoyltransferase C-terminal domain-containing protein n=4 Tax=unclassified Alcanivorax TaxID=2638842 RepID=UPI0007BA0431|nr:carbamoyltransferase C-terminal domain-containing protein [Alcanivorax sp. HI0044]KZY37106.1 hypothetical protein A3730_01680 [Alcanivorax sp. HI0044]